MNAPAPQKTPAKAWGSRLKRLALKVVSLVVSGLVFGAAYNWAVPRCYGPDQVSGFRLGVLHGALMPVALPSLLMGKDVPIYAGNNVGRIYKIGYIAGINLCGLFFFGITFWPSRKPKSAA